MTPDEFEKLCRTHRTRECQRDVKSQEHKDRGRLIDYVSELKLKAEKWDALEAQAIDVAATLADPEFQRWKAAKVAISGEDYEKLNTRLHRLLDIVRRSRQYVDPYVGCSGEEANQLIDDIDEELARCD